MRGYSEQRLARYAEVYPAAAAELERRQHESDPVAAAPPVAAQLEQTERALRDLQSERRKVLRQARGGGSEVLNTRAEQMLDTIRRLRARARDLRLLIDAGEG